MQIALLAQLLPRVDHQLYSISSSTQRVDVQFLGIPILPPTTPEVASAFATRFSTHQSVELAF